ncbi:hypothetical protein [Rubrobacter aplysinae]|uniref:hypothetical protein n=1 Tax=Rubrobacter aplysinae TaxID=909625 RepID=UPI00128E859C|nr:hypothetical protein [Rubrobacter aplysinae]
MTASLVLLLLDIYGYPALPGAGAAVFAAPGAVLTFICRAMMVTWPVHGGPASGNVIQLV